MKKIKSLGLLLVSVSLIIFSFQILNLPLNVLAATATVNLFTADDFAILGASTVTNTGSSVITGNLGLSPGTSITGFPPGTVSGITHAADAVALQAQNDATTASNDITGRACDTDLSGQDLGGLTLTSGVYCFSSSAQLTGTLTLNGQGDPDAVFIFKISSTLTTASSSSVSLINSAQSCNVFWQVGSSATLGTSTNFKGNILASDSVTFNTSASLIGRAMAKNGAVTLDTNNVSKAVCATPTDGPSPTPTPTTAVSDSSSNSGSVGVANIYCPPLKENIVTPMVIESKRIDADSIFIKWGPYSGVDTFNVEYGFEEGKLIYNTNVTGFSTTINSLHPNQPIWVRVADRNDCQIGVYGQPKLVGGPRLPNTGFGPGNRT